METVTVEQLVAAPRATVRQAFLDPDQLARWWWPHLPDVTYEMAPEPGGRYRIRSEAAGFGVHGEILTIGDGAAVITWIWEDGATDRPPETVTIQFSEPAEGDGTLVTVTHPCTAADDMRQGWTETLALLGRLHGGL